MDREREVDPTHRTFVSYIDKSREYYLAQGFGNPYRWACFDEVPFARLSKPVSQARLALITTASMLDEERRPSRAVQSVASLSPPDRLYTDHRFWDKDATHTEDLDSYFPAHRLQELVEQGRIGSLTARFHCVPTEYSQRKTVQEDAPEVLKRAREDGAEAAILVPL